MSEEVTYIVSGCWRSGTSMMMNALDAGGLVPAFSEKRNVEMGERLSDEFYHPNKSGFYELSKEEYKDISFPDKYKGKLIKCLFGGVNNLTVGNYKIVFMLRDPEEIRQSYHSGLNHEMPKNVFENYYELMKKIIDQLHNRRDVNLVVFQYSEVIKDPRCFFSVLKNDYGFPINVGKAVETIDPEKYRFNIENLVVGL